jgi:hypothetical protein
MVVAMNIGDNNELSQLTEADVGVYDLLESIKLWAGVEPFIEGCQDYSPLPNSYLQFKASRALMDVRTFVVCLLLFRRYACIQYEKAKGRECTRPYTLRSLAMKIDGRTPDALKAAEGKLKRLMESIKNYDIISVSRGIYDGRECMSIEPTEKLVRYFVQTFSNPVGEKL